MRSLSIIKTLIAAVGALLLMGCLISEEPLLDAANGHATPLDPGAYLMCPVKGDANRADCEQFMISHDDAGLYRFDKDGEDPIEMRFRRIGRRGFAAQSLEDNDDAYLYYYGAGKSQRFILTMMLCANLPAGKRTELIENGDLESDDDDFEACTVKSLRGLIAAAKAYHRGQAEGGEEIALEFTPAPDAG